VTPVFTPEEIEAGIARAVRDREFVIIPALVKLLAVQSPERAQAVLDALRGRVTVVMDLSEVARA
jgi:hypothetical protein